MKLAFATLAGVAALCAAPAAAGTVTVTTLNNAPYFATPGVDWGIYAGDNGAGSSAAITATAPRSGTGSLELRGDLTRVQTGFQYAPLRTTIASLAGTTGLTFDWQVAADSSNQTYTPALRLLIQDGNTRTQLIWEGANNASALGTNGTAATNPTGVWYTSGINDLFYQNVAGSGPVYQPGTQTYVLRTIADWVSTFSSAATISAISVGDGSGAGAGYHGFVDNVTLTRAGTSTTYNFETAAGAVPEPATWAMMVIGFGAVGYGMRRRKAVSGAAFAA